MYCLAHIGEISYNTCRAAFAKNHFTKIIVFMYRKTRFKTKTASLAYWLRVGGMACLATKQKKNQTKQRTKNKKTRLVREKMSSAPHANLNGKSSTALYISRIPMNNYGGGDEAMVHRQTRAKVPSIFRQSVHRLGRSYGQAASRMTRITTWLSYPFILA